MGWWHYGRQRPDIPIPLSLASAGTLGPLTYITVRNLGTWPAPAGDRPLTFRNDSDLYEGLAR